MCRISGSAWALYALAVVVLAFGLIRPSTASAQTPTPTPGGPCCSAHAGPGCDDVACRDCVCEADPVCCVAGWDSTCAETDTIIHCPDECGCNITPAPTPTPGGPCCSVRPTPGGPGCDDSTCQACVCGQDSTCCTMVWDAFCISRAQVECADSCPCGPLPTETPVTPGPTPTPGGDCCAGHEGPSCDDSECRTCVCNIDNECCTGIWDDRCTQEARMECAIECPCATTGDCCADHSPGIGCEDASCKNCVCGIDVACCTDGEGWDADCVSEANNECAASCTCEDAGTCCEAHPDTVGCDDQVPSGAPKTDVCQTCVCGLDPSCCDPETGWDATCAQEAALDCHERCVGCGVSDCCDVRVGPGCSDDACESCVCGMDDFCCNQQTGVWDGSCVDIAFGSCGSTCQCEATPSCPGDCSGDGTVAINELISCVNIALGGDLSGCPACDVSGDGNVAINELIAAVGAAQSGCP